MRYLVLTLAVILISFNTYGQFIPSWERPIKSSSDMRFEQSENSLRVFEKVGMSVNKRDDSQRPTSITVKLETADTTQDIQLVIIDEVEDACGSITYTGQIEHDDQVSIDLVDHATRHCEDIRPYEWEAGLKIDEEFVEIQGNPKAVFTIL